MNPAHTVLYIPPELAKFKLNLFNRIGEHIKKLGGKTTRDYAELDKLPNEMMPIVGCSPQLTPYIKKWMATGRPFIYWDRGYARRVFATDLPRGDNGGYYRWHLSAFQMQEIKSRSSDRWNVLKIDPNPWNKNGKHVVVASPSPTYERFHAIEGWTNRTLSELKKLTDRPIVVRDKEMQRRASDGMPDGRRLWDDCKEAHALVTHGSIAGVEAAIMGCPVFVDSCSAAYLVGLTSLAKIEEPVYPDRQPWLNALAYCQFNEQELIDGTLWRLL